MIKKTVTVSSIDVMRRRLLQWTTPAIAMVVLPAHAQISNCSASPLLEATVASKCAGDPPVGQAVLTLISDGLDLNGANTLVVSAINVTGTGAGDTITLPSFPATIDATSGVDIEWTGDASDALTCLPLSPIEFEVVYNCESVEIEMTIVFSLIEVLAAAVA
ncbi:hypothetical protein N9060_01090 [Arenicella sp.]|nr:hypothetical protein [Arenicella sp.]